MKLIDKRNLIGVILMGILLAITGRIFSQQKQPPSAENIIVEQPPSAENIIARMKQDLNLSDEQVRQITPIMQDAIQQRREIRSQELDEDAVRTQMQAVRQSTESKLAQYLTQDQLTQWKKMRPPPPSQK